MKDEHQTRLSKVLEGRGVKLVDLARLTGRSVGYLSEVINGKKPGSADVWERIASVLGTSIEEIRGATADVDPNAVPAQQPHYRLPVKAAVRAGPADEAIEPTNEPLGWEWSNDGPQDLCDVIQVMGDSMEPDFRDGDRVVVKRGEVPRNGDVVVAEYSPNGDESERLTTLKVYFRERGVSYLVPINRARYRTIVMDRHWKVKGVMVKHVKRNARALYVGLEAELFGPPEDDDTQQ